MIKSFINYPGGKYRLLSQILPLFPLAYDNFVDMFVGSAVVSANIPLDVPIFAYDLDRKLIELLKFVQRVPAEYIIMNVEKLIEKYNLSDTRANGYHFYGLDSANGVSSVNKPGFNLMRQDYNDGVLHHIDAEIYLYTLVVFGFNNQIRFNHQGNFNNPTGKRDFNTKMRTKLIDFSDRIKEINIKFYAEDFNAIPETINNSFYYADPPYLITTAVYNENGGWNNYNECRLLKKLDLINESGNMFALSNVLTSKNRTNKILLDWSQNYNIHHLNMEYGNSNYQTFNSGKTDEVLITNY